MTDDTFRPIGDAAANVLLQLDQKRRRHRWTSRNAIDPNTTTRVCEHCGIIRITRHEPGNFPPHWVEFERDGAKITTAKTPACEATA